MLTAWRWFVYARRDRFPGILYLIGAFLVMGLVLFQGWYGGEMVYTQGAGVAAVGKGTEPASNGKQRLDKVTKSGDWSDCGFLLLSISILRLLRPRPLESRCFARLENSITSKEEWNALDHPGDSNHSLAARFSHEDWRRPYSLNPGNRADHFDYSIGDWAARLTLPQVSG